MPRTKVKAMQDEKAKDIQLPGNEQFNELFDLRFAQKMQEWEGAKTPSLSLIASKGTLDMAYPPLILASTASALGWNVSIFFTFYGLEILKRQLDLSVSPLGNPAMPMEMPIGPDWFQHIRWQVPNIVMSNVPGFEQFATSMMKKTIDKKGVASIEDLRSLCIEAGVNIFACQMTVDLFGYDQEDFIPEVTEWVGAASYLVQAQKSDLSLFI
jgi:peroxiredoxin family protein